MAENVRIITNVFPDYVIKEEQMHAQVNKMVSIVAIIQNVAYNWLVENPQATHTLLNVLIFQETKPHVQVIMIVNQLIFAGKKLRIKQLNVYSNFLLLIEPNFSGIYKDFRKLQKKQFFSMVNTVIHQLHKTQVLMGI